MKVQRSLLILFVLLFCGHISMAAGNGELLNNFALGAIIIMLVLFTVVCVVLLNTVKIITSFLKKQKEEVLIASADNEYAIDIQSADKQTFWQKILSLRPMSEEKDMMTEHEYDGIKELDNPPPGWFMYLFYASIILAFVYLLNFHVFKLGKLQDEEYVVEMKEAEVVKAAFLAKSANTIDENSVALSTDAGVLAAGKAVFTKNCVACHGPNGQGIVGPNLTDDYWLHGGKINNIFKTIKYGVSAKGMISWEKQLTPTQMSDVANYIKSLKGTNPPNPKEQQGQKEI